MITASYYASVGRATEAYGSCRVCLCVYMLLCRCHLTSFHHYKYLHLCVAMCVIQCMRGCNHHHGISTLVLLILAAKHLYKTHMLPVNYLKFMCETAKFSRTATSMHESHTQCRRFDRSAFIMILLLVAVINTQLSVY